MSNTNVIPQLDARPDRIDLRDRAYLPPLKALLPEFPPAEYISEYSPSIAALFLIRDRRVPAQDSALPAPSTICNGVRLSCRMQKRKGLPRRIFHRR